MNKMNNKITTSLEATKSIDLNNTASVSESVGFSITTSGSVGLNITTSRSVGFSITASGFVDASTAYSESVNNNDAIVPSESIDLNATADSGYDTEEWKSIDIGHNPILGIEQFVDEHSHVMALEQHKQFCNRHIPQIYKTMADVHMVAGIKPRSSFDSMRIAVGDGEL
ncbi:hypothetical protein LINGRAHAP2_LOCUS31727 [Linum grandiflorum]